MSHSPAWQAARAARAQRRANDPEVQARARRHEARLTQAMRDVEQHGWRGAHALGSLTESSAA